jgi:hypothetical protein
MAKNLIISQTATSSSKMASSYEFPALTPLHKRARLSSPFVISMTFFRLF